MRKWLRRLAVAVLTLVVLVAALVGTVYFANRDIIRGVPLEPSRAAASLIGALPAAEGWDAAILEDARREADAIRTTAVVALHDGQVVVEWGATDRRISGHSVRKSLVSVLYGIAADRGLIDVEGTLAELGIDDVNPPLTEAERSARLVDLLTCRSGIYHDSVKADMETNRPARGSHAPGESFFYNNWSFNALGGIFEQLTGLGMGEAFEQWVADPIGMHDFRVEDVRYERSEASSFPSYRFWITARDLALVGLLFQREGRWGDVQIVSAEWVRQSTAAHTDFDDGRGYGYMWWTFDDGRYLASGTGGQKLLVDPARKLVVVNRVDTGDGLRRGLWFAYGPRVRNRQFLGLVDRIAEAAPGELRQPADQTADQTAVSPSGLP